MVKRHYFVNPGGPLGPYADGYREYLVAAGYSFGALEHRVTQFAEISRWLSAEGLGAGDLDEFQARRFVAARRARGRVTWTSPAGLRVPLAFLRSVGVVPDRPEAEGVFEALLAEYRRYLFNERGLTDKTVAAHLDAARRFCHAVVSTPEELAVLGPSEVNSYVLAACSRQSVNGAKKTVGAVASLLRYLHLTARMRMSRTLLMFGDGPGCYATSSSSHAGVTVWAA